MADEGQPVEVGLFVTALVALRTVGLADEAHLLVIADRRHLDAGTFGQFTDGQHDFLHISGKDGRTGWLRRSESML
ncbi:hypothetical protein D3C71_1062390 [compost metagenome]